MGQCRSRELDLTHLNQQLGAEHINIEDWCGGQRGWSLPLDSLPSYADEIGPRHLPFDPDLTCINAVPAPWPLSLCGTTLFAKTIVDIAHEAWATDDADRLSAKYPLHRTTPWWGWYEHATLEYVCSILSVADEIKAFKNVALRLLARIQPFRNGDVFGTAEQVMRKLQGVTMQLSADLCPQLLQWRTDNPVATARLAAEIPPAIDPNLSQRAVCPLFGDAFAEHFLRLHANLAGGRGLVRYIDVETGEFGGNQCSLHPLQHMLAWMANEVQPYFKNLTQRLERLFKASDCLGIKDVASKTSDRMVAKMKWDNRRRPFAAQFNKDVNRTAIECLDADALVRIFGVLRDNVRLMGVKNTYALSDEEATEEHGGFMQILVNFVFEPVHYEARLVPAVSFYYLTDSFAADDPRRDNFFVRVRASDRNSYSHMQRGHNDAARHDARYISATLSDEEYRALPERREQRVRSEADSRAAFNVLDANPLLSSAAPVLAEADRSLYTHFHREARHVVPGDPLTYADLVALAGPHVRDGSLDRLFGVDLLRAAVGVLGIRDDAVRLIGEIQLHLPYFLEQRKKTHLWFKINRCPPNTIGLGNLQKAVSYTHLTLPTIYSV